MHPLFEKLKQGQLLDTDRIEFLEELYWTDLNKVEKEDLELKNTILKFLREDKFSDQELSLILLLYNNPSGAWIEDFSKLIGDFYHRDKSDFIKALHLNKDGIDNLVYLFRNDKVFEDEDKEQEELLNMDSLSGEEKETVQQFFRMYETVCST